MVVRCRFGQTGKRLKPVKESHRDKLQAAHKPFMQNTFDCDPSDSDLMASAKRIVSPRAARTRGSFRHGAKSRNLDRNADLFTKTHCFYVSIFGGVKHSSRSAYGPGIS